MKGLVPCVAGRWRGPVLGGTFCLVRRERRLDGFEDWGADQEAFRLQNAAGLKLTL